MDMSRSVGPLPPDLGPWALGPRKQKHFVFWRKNGPWASHPLEIHTQNAVNKHFADVM